MFAEPVCTSTFQDSKRNHTKPAPDAVLSLLHPVLTDSYVRTALATLPPTLQYDRWEDALKMIFNLLIETRKPDPVDEAIFALFQCPVDEVAHEYGRAGTTHGAIEMIANDCACVTKTVTRHFQEIQIQIAKAYLCALANDLERARQYTHQLHIQILLDMLTDELRAIV